MARPSMPGGPGGDDDDDAPDDVTLPGGDATDEQGGADQIDGGGGAPTIDEDIRRQIADRGGPTPPAPDEPAEEPGPSDATPGVQTGETEKTATESGGGVAGPEDLPEAPARAEPAPGDTQPTTDQAPTRGTGGGTAGPEDLPEAPTDADTGEPTLRRRKAERSAVDEEPTTKTAGGGVAGAPGSGTRGEEIPGRGTDLPGERVSTPNVTARETAIRRAERRDEGPANIGRQWQVGSMDREGPTIDDATATAAGVIGGVGQVAREGVGEVSEAVGITTGVAGAVGRAGLRSGSQTAGDVTEQAEQAGDIGDYEINLFKGVTGNRLEKDLEQAAAGWEDVFTGGVAQIATTGAPPVAFTESGLPAGTTAQSEKVLTSRMGEIEGAQGTRREIVQGAAGATNVPGFLLGVKEATETGAYAVGEGVEDPQQTAAVLAGSGIIMGQQFKRYATKNPVQFGTELGLSAGIGKVVAPYSPVRAQTARIPDADSPTGTSTYRGVVFEKPGAGGRPRPIIGLSGKRPTTGTPDVDVDSTPMTRGAEGTAPTTQLETTIVEKNLLQNLDEPSKQRLESALQLQRTLGDRPASRRAGSRIPATKETEGTIEDAIRAAERLPDEAAGDVAEYLREQNAMVGGSANQLIQTGKSRTPKDLDIYVEDTATTSHELASMLREHTDKPVRVRGGVEIQTGGGWKHLVDVNERQRGTTGLKDWGGRLYEPTQGGRGGQLQPMESQLSSKIEGAVRIYDDDTIGPKTHRTKDVVDVESVAEGLIEQRSRSLNPLQRYRARKAQSALEDYRSAYGDLDLPDESYESWGEFTSQFDITETEFTGTPDIDVGGGGRPRPFGDIMGTRGQATLSGKSARSSVFDVADEGDAPTVRSALDETGDTTAARKLFDSDDAGGGYTYRVPDTGDGGLTYIPSTTGDRVVNYKPPGDGDGGYFSPGTDGKYKSISSGDTTYRQPGGGEDYTPPGEGSEYVPPGGDTSYTPPTGEGSEYVPPGGDTSYTPPTGEGGEYVPPGGDTSYTPPPGEGGEYVPPGGDDGYVPPNYDYSFGGGGERAPGAGYDYSYGPGSGVKYGYGQAVGDEFGSTVGGTKTQTSLEPKPDKKDEKRYIPTEKRPQRDEPAVLTPGWLSQTVTTIGTLGQVPVGELTTEELAEAEPFGEYTGEFPTFAMEEGSETTQETIADVSNLLAGTQEAPGGDTT